MIIGAVILYILVSVLADGHEQEARWKILTIALAVGVINSVVSRIEPRWVPYAVALLVVPLAIAAALIYWCGIGRRPSIKIAASFLGIQLALGILFGLMASRGM